MWEVTREDVKGQMEHYSRMAIAGADDTEAIGLGPPVVLWRRFRDSTETREVLPLWLAELTLAAIPHNEPAVERARLER